MVKFQGHLKKEFPYLQTGNSKLLLAVSGGLDSVVLTHLFAQSGFNCVIAHCNFQLRGEESERDEQFVRSLGAKYNIEVIVKRFETEGYAQQHKLSIQEAARNLRYDWFRALMENGEQSIVNDESSMPARTRHWGGVNGESPMVNGEPAKQEENSNDSQLTSSDTSFTAHHSPFTIHDARFTITAHHANDTIETLLINFFRGTGISGLHGIPSRQDKILRPLLFAKREDILAYAKENNLEWVEDSSNASDKYTRNFIRLQLLPIAKEIFSNAEDNLLQNIERFKEAETLYNQAVALHKTKLLEQKGNEWHIPVLKLQKTIPLNTIVWEIIKEFGFNAAQVPEIVKLLDAGNGSYVASATNRVIKNRNWLIIAPLQTGEARHILIEEGDKKIVFEDGTIVIAPIADCRLPIVDSAYTSHPAPVPGSGRHSRLTTDDSRFTATVDASQLQFPLLLRKWKQGDYFYPLGMQKKKKLAKFFIDQKLSKTAKEKVWVLETNKKIIWVVGLRIDDRFKLTTQTQKSLQINFISY